MPVKPNRPFRDPAEWARAWGWINRRQADEMRQALRDLIALAEELALPVEDGDEEWPQIAEAKRVLNKRVHRYPNPRPTKAAALREP